MDAREAFEAARAALSARQVFGEPVERDGVTVIPAATVIGGGGGGGGGRRSREGEATRPDEEGGAGMGFGLVAWASGAFEIRDGRVTWRPAIDLTRILLAAIGVGTLLARGILAARRRRVRG
ncbi:MAG TPA: hypothetical protein VE997_05965 [Candidatus Limnocylindria bacterium]|nr:hypothetical protein [Candidatus Limnocylindria bacterium]